MKATGEVMAIGRTIEESLLKAVRGLEVGATHLWQADVAAANDETITDNLITVTDERLFYIAEAFRRDFTLSEVAELTKINPFFLAKIQHIVALEGELQAHPGDLTLLPVAKRNGFADATIALYWHLTAAQVRTMRKEAGIVPVYKMVDTCAGEFESTTPYFYSTYENETESTRSARESVLVLGSGPIRIGQGVEFDYARCIVSRPCKRPGTKPSL